MEAKEIRRLEAFHLAIFKSKKKKSEIAKEMKITKSYFSNMLSGRHELLEKHRQSLNKILNTSI